VTGAERAALVLLVWCGFCWAEPGTACTLEGQHLARYLRAHRRGLIGRDELTSVCRPLPVASAGQLVADMTAPPRGAAAVDGHEHAAAARDQ
jgi:hypothetical protein